MKLQPTEWALDPAGLDLLLRRLDPDREQAGEGYLRLQLRLTVYFEGQRCANAELLADEALNRLTRRLQQGEEIADVSRYALGVARNLLREYYRRPEASAAPLADLLPVHEWQAQRKAEHQAQSQAAAEQRADCMRRCLAALDAESRELLRRYFVGGNLVERRRALATEMGLSANALSLRVFRLREKLNHCGAACLRRS